MRRAPLILATAVSLVLITATTALGHAELQSAVPGPGDVVSTVPGQLVARFSEDLHADRTSIELRDANGNQLAQGGKDPDRARVQQLTLPPLEPGIYEVRWVTFSADDDEVARGRYQFTVEAAPASAMPSSAPVSCPSAPPSEAPGTSPPATMSSQPEGTTAEAASVEPDASTTTEASDTAEAPMAAPATADPCASADEQGSDESSEPSSAVENNLVEASTAP